MSLRRLAILFMKEVRLGATNFMVVFALVVPVFLSLVVSLLFGDLFSTQPRLGFVDEGVSEFVKGMQSLDHIQSTLYTSVDEMIHDAEKGIIQSGLLIPAEFDDNLRSNHRQTVKVYTWGETPYRDRLIADTAIANMVALVAGLPTHVSVHIVQLGQSSTSSLGEQMLPMLVLMTIMLGGVVVTAVSVIIEKQNNTLSAMAVTPAYMFEVLAAKALLGIFIGVVTGVITLTINHAFSSNPPLLMLILIMAAVVASLLGLLLGLLLKDMQMLLAILKAGGIILFAPGILEMMPQAPPWLARLFPTYYLMHPLIAVAERGERFSEVMPDLLIMLAFLCILLLWLTRMGIKQAKNLSLLG